MTRGANGGLQRTTKKITPLEQLGIVNATPGVWGNDGIEMFNQLYSGLRNTRGKSELPSQGAYADSLRAYNTQMQAQTSQKDMLSAMKMLTDYEQKSKAPMSAEQFLRTMPKSVLEMAFPPRYEEGSDPNDPERPTKPYTPQEIAARTNELMAELRNRASGNGEEQNDALRNTLIAGVRKMMGLDAPPVPEDVAAFQQRQRGRQMQQVEAAQARADITQRPQQLINYFKDGKWHSGNGYIRDGKVYDGQGYEIEGATPAEMARGNDGGVVSNERGWFARALPSARELVGGGAGGGNAGEGATQGAKGEGGVNWTPGHDLRNDGKTYKGTGWLGVLRLPNGGVASEYTIGVNIDGKEIDIPTLVPTLTKEEQDLMVNDVIPNNKDVPDSIVKKAVDFAKMRLANGRSVFANDGTPQGGQSQPAAQATQGEQPVATQPAQDGQPQPAEAQEQGDQKEQVGVQSGDLLAPENADAFIADVNKGLDPEKSRAIEIEAAAKAEKARRQKKSAEPIDDREWAETMKSANESTGGVVQRDKFAEAKVRFNDMFDEIARDANLAASKSVEFDKKHVGADKGIKFDDAYKAIFTRLVRDKLNGMSRDDMRNLEYVDPDNAKPQHVNIRQSIYDRYGIDIYENPGLWGAISGSGGVDSRPFYEDLVDSDGKRRKGTWRRAKEYYDYNEGAVSLGKQN